jgi:hypothetical protein
MLVRSAGIVLLLCVSADCFAQNVEAMRQSCEEIQRKATGTTPQKVYVDNCVTSRLKLFNQRVEELSNQDTGQYKKEVATCVIQAFQTMGFSAPGFGGTPCYAFVKVTGVQTVDSRDIPGGLEVLAEVTVEGLQQIARGSMVGRSCGFPVDVEPGEVFRMPARLLFEKWKSGLRCTSRSWQ